MASAVNEMSEGSETVDDSSNSTPEDQNDQETFPPSWASCVVCKCYPKSPKTLVLPCLHIFCSETCLNKLFEQHIPPHCPECYLVADRGTVRPCDYLNDNIEVASKEDKKTDESAHERQICKNCVKEFIAQKWCVDCREFLCEFCCEYHQYSKATRGHTLAPTSEGVIELTEGNETSVEDRKCQLHSEEILIAFCFDCQAAMCSICISQHAKHTMESLKDLANSVKRKFYDGVDNINFIKQRCEDAVRELDIKSSFVLDDQKHYLQTKAAEYFKRLIDTLLNHENQVRKNLVHTMVAKAKELNIKKAKTKSISRQCEQYLAISRDVIEKGTIWNVLCLREFIENQYNELQHMQDTLKDPEKFNSFVEKNWAYYVDPKPVEMAERCIQLTCQALYRDYTKEGVSKPFSSHVIAEYEAKDEVSMDDDTEVVEGSE